MEAIETIRVGKHIRAELVPDEYHEMDNFDIAQVAYLDSGRYTLGTEAVSRERMNEIAAGIKDGSLIGLPVSAYIHSGVTIWVGAETSPFDQAGWDSGQCGFVYMSREDAILNWGGKGQKRMTKKVLEGALSCCRSTVEEVDSCLRGDVYGIIWYDGDEEIDSCWGFVGFEYAKQEAEARCEGYEKDRQVKHREAWRAALVAARQRKRDLDASYAGL